MKPSPARTFFGAIARRYDRDYVLDAAESRARMKRVLDALPANAAVLDLGVGTGRELPALLDAGHRPTGLDFSSEMLALCSKRSRPVPLVEASFWDPLPFPDATFDAALALHGTLAHPPDDDALPRLVRELARVVRPGGVFVAEVPAPAWLDAIERATYAGPRRMRRIADDRCVHEDDVAGHAVEARVLSEDAWRALFGSWTVRIEPLGALELLVVAEAPVR